MEGLLIRAEVISIREADEYQGKPGGYWLLLEDQSGRQYSVKSEHGNYEVGGTAEVPVRPRAKKNGEGFWYIDSSRPAAQLRAAV